jgi:hypothetical protein
MPRRTRVDLVKEAIVECVVVCLVPDGVGKRERRRRRRRRGKKGRSN